MIIEEHPNCSKCGLFKGCKSPFMQSAGSDHPMVLVIGEAPGADEDRLGVPFVGRSGKLLRDVLSEVGLDVDEDVRFTNTVKCRPPDNVMHSKYITHCKHYLEDEIAHYDPQLILLMGNSPLRAVLGENNISQWNGVSIQRDGRNITPVYHPSYILRNSAVLAEWVDGIYNAVDSMITGDAGGTLQFTQHYPSTLSEIADMVSYLKGCDIISYDVETAGLDPHGKDNCILCVSFAGGDRTYALVVDHKESHSRHRQHVVRAIKDILTGSAFIIGHNIKFDQQHTRAALGIEFTASGDTMIINHLLHSKQGIHGLKRLAGLHLGMYDYDAELQSYIAQHIECDYSKGGSYSNIPLSVLLPYAALDAEATLKLWFVLYNELNDVQQHFFNQVLMPVSNVLADVEYNGNAVDTYIIDRYMSVYGYVQQELLDRLLSTKEVKSTIAHLQSVADTKIIQSLPPGAQYTIQDDHITYTTPNGRSSRRKRDVVTFNPNSVIHLRHLYFHTLGIPVTELTDTGLPSTSSSAMKQYPFHNIIDTITHYKLLTKMIGTYLLPAYNGSWISGDGRVHSTYNLHGTRTGRLSSSNPNMQNIPTPEKEAETRPRSVVVNLPVKNIFTHTFLDGVLMSVDYSGMELRVFASLAKCYPMLEIHKSGADFHSMVAIMAMTGRQPRDITIEETKIFKREQQAIRYRYKWTNWTLLYGGDEYTLMNLYGMSEQEAKDTVRSYYDTFPEVLHFRQYCVQFAEAHGYIESPFGRKEHLPYINDDTDRAKRNGDRRAAVNMPVQSAASDVLLCAMIIIHDKLRCSDMRTMLVNTVHDSIVLDVPPDEIDTAAAICTDVMENIARYADEYFPNVNFSWLLSPLRAEVSVGTHYGVETSYNEWVSKGKPEL